MKANNEKSVKPKGNLTLKLSQIKLPVTHNFDDLHTKILGVLKISSDELISYQVIRKSLDARKKPNLYYVYTVVVNIGLKAGNPLEKGHGLTSNKFLSKLPIYVEIYTEIKYNVPAPVSSDSNNIRPIIIGAGPAGLFCGYLLAKCGFNPIILERGADVDQRIKDVESFWREGQLNLNSNVQFGEGGAGTFSDGKLNTLVKDKSGRNKFVLETLVDHGAPQAILYEQKPHVGTDILANVVKNIRKSIVKLGGEVRFNTRLIGIDSSEYDNGNENSSSSKKDGNINIMALNEFHNKINLSTNHLILAIGHSARDTFEMLYDNNIPMEAKAFAVGVRIEHNQELINISQYGTIYPDTLPAASYKLAEQLDNGRGVYSFCMCPGGYVVNASSEGDMLAINGMSYSDRGSNNANSAIVVTVTPNDFPSNHPLRGVAFQRELESKAYEIGDGKIPVQKLGDYCNNSLSIDFGSIKPNLKGDWKFANLKDIFPEEINKSLEEGILRMGNKIKGFSHDDAILSGVESRTSSPVRIIRNEAYESEIKGIYPCGEGAGYAGGIMSAAMDGLKVAEAILQKRNNKINS